MNKLYQVNISGELYELEGWLVDRMFQEPTAKLIKRVDRQTGYIKVSINTIREEYLS